MFIAIRIQPIILLDWCTYKFPTLVYIQIYMYRERERKISMRVHALLYPVTRTTSQFCADLVYLGHRLHGFLTDYAAIPTPKSQIYTTENIHTSEEYPHILKELLEGSQAYSDLEAIFLK